MTRLTTIVRILAGVLVFAIVILPHLASLRLGHGRLARRIPMLFHRSLLRIFSVRVTESGTPPAEGEGALVLANHVSWLDIVALGALRPLSFVAKSEIAGWPLVGTLARLQRSVFIDRSKRGATANVNATVGERLARGELVVLFAEGTTGDGLHVLPFRSSLVGAARTALAAGTGRVRLQPLALAYTARGGLPLTRAERPEVAWYGDMDLAPHLALFAARGPLDLQLVWGNPVAFEAGTDRKVATARAEAEVRLALREALSGRRGARRTEGDVPTSRGSGLEDADLSASGLAAM